jgi:hypothetical protein
LRGLAAIQVRLGKPPEDERPGDLGIGFNDGVDQFRAWGCWDGSTSIISLGGRPQCVPMPLYLVIDLVDREARKARLHGQKQDGRGEQ